MDELSQLCHWFAYNLMPSKLGSTTNKILQMNPIFGKYVLHNLHGQAVQIHFFTVLLKESSDSISLIFSGKSDHNCGDR